MWSIYSAFLNVPNWNGPPLSLIFHERPHFPKMYISEDLVNSVNVRFLSNFCGRYLVDKVLCGRYLVDIRVFWWLIWDKTPVVALHVYLLPYFVWWVSKKSTFLISNGRFRSRPASKEKTPRTRNRWTDGKDIPAQCSTLNCHLITPHTVCEPDLNSAVDSSQREVMVQCVL